METAGSGFPLMPGNNPTGMNYPVPGATTGAPTTNPFVSGAANPYMSQMKTATPGAGSTAVPGAFPQNASPYGRGVQMPSPMAGAIDPNSVPQNQLQNMFGGLGPAIQQLLGSQGGYNQQAVNAILAQMQPGIQQGQANLLEQFGSMGGRYSSGAQLGLADYLSQVQLNEGDIMSQMYMQSYQNLMNEIMGLTGPAEQYQQSRPTTWDIISGILGMGTQLGVGALTGGLGGKK